MHQGQVRGRVRDPEVHIEGANGLVDDKKIHSTDQDAIRMVSIERGENEINVHRIGVVDLRPPRTARPHGCDVRSYADLLSHRKGASLMRRW